MQEEDDSDNLDKDSQHVEYLSGVSHVEEDSKDVNRKQGKYDSLYSLDNDFLEVVACIFQVICIQVCQSQSDSKCHNEGSHHVERFRNGYREERGNTFGLTDFG